MVLVEVESVAGGEEKELVQIVEHCMGHVSRELRAAAPTHLRVSVSS